MTTVRIFNRRFGIFFFSTVINEGESIVTDPRIDGVSDLSNVTLVRGGALEVIRPDSSSYTITGSDIPVDMSLIQPGEYVLTSLATCEYSCVGPIPGANHGPASFDHLVIPQGAETVDTDNYMVLMTGKLSSSSTDDILPGRVISPGVSLTAVEDSHLVKFDGRSL